MDAVASPDPDTLPAVPVSAGRRADMLRDALRPAADGGEHRLFRGGKLPGLFPARSGPAADIALAALADGLLETVRTEVRGKVVTEWVRLTPKGVRHLGATDSPQAAARELAAAVADARTGVAAQLVAAREAVAALGEQLNRQAAEFTARLDALSARLDGVLRRADLSATADAPPWAAAALLYLDARPGFPCPLAELFGTLGDVSLSDFHAGLVRLAAGRAVQLLPEPEGEPEYALLHGPVAAHAVTR